MSYIGHHAGSRWTVGGVPPVIWLLKIIEDRYGSASLILTI